MNTDTKRQGTNHDSLRTLSALFRRDPFPLREGTHW